MKIEIEPSQSLSLERKVKMQEAREGIIDRLARDLPTNIYTQLTLGKQKRTDLLLMSSNGGFSCSVTMHRLLPVSYCEKRGRKKIKILEVC